MNVLVAPNSFAVWNFLRRQVSDLYQSYKQNQQIRSTINELSRLTDHELNDIGIGRGDIWSIAHEDASFKRAADLEGMDINPNLKGWA